MNTSLYTFNISKNMKNEVEMRKEKEKWNTCNEIRELQIDFYLHNLSPWGTILWTLMNVEMRKVKDMFNTSFRLDGLKKDKKERVKDVRGNGRANSIFMCHRF